MPIAYTPRELLRTTTQGLHRAKSRLFPKGYGGFHPLSRIVPIGAGPMLELKHCNTETYARWSGTRLAHLLQTPPLNMISPEGRSLPAPTAELLTWLLQEGLDVQLRLSGWSMKPLVPSGSVVRFSRSGEPSVGDIVLARLPNDTLVAHRVIAHDSDRIWTKGDACQTADGPLSRESVIARAVRLEGRISLPLSNFWMRALGLLVNRFYPLLAAGYRARVPRTVRAESAS